MASSLSKQLNPSYLIVNADDYGYSSRISEGILQAAKQGVVSATGVMANCASFDRQVAQLKSCPELDVGVHLTISSGDPLSSGMQQALDQLGREQFFDSKFSAIAAILRRRLPLAVIKEEWDCQIARCREAGLDIVFLNSHEHVHMFPALSQCAVELARRHGIANIRRTTAEWQGRMSAVSVLRSSILWALDKSVRSVPEHTVTSMLGASVSGKLDEDYLVECVSRLKPGEVYELMCHPGLQPKGDAMSEKIQSFHDWQTELDALCKVFAPDTISRWGIQMIGYRECGTFRL